MSEQRKLRPCPFCGASGDNISMANTGACWVRCLIVDCNCDGPVCDTEDDAANAWNTRVVLTDEQHGEPK